MPFNATDILAKLDIFMRGGSCMVLFLIAFALIRNFGKTAIGQLAVFFTTGSIAFAICSLDGMHQFLGLYALPMHAIAAGNNVIFWFLARSIFDDEFKVRWYYWLIWIAVVALAIAQYIAAPNAAIALLLMDFLTAQTFIFTILAIFQTITTWREDLVENRRILRVFLLCSVLVFTCFNIISNISGSRLVRPALFGFLSSVLLVGISMPIAIMLLNIPKYSASLFGINAKVKINSNLAISRDDKSVLAKLKNLLENDRVYRQDGVTIGDLAHALGVQEYRLRSLINQELGFRNFSNFINNYRIEDAIAGLSDKSQVEVPILTIAFDAGFASLGPFNRAFKSRTNMTPSDFRKRALET